MTEPTEGTPSGSGTPSPEPVQVVAAVAGFAAATWWRATRWGIDSGWRAGDFCDGVLPEAHTSPP